MEKEHQQQLTILTGDRPTGRLHLGHYVGSLKNRLKYQEEGAKVFVIIADYHTLTTKHSKEHIKAVQENARELVKDYLSIGIDPQKTTIYLQSLIPQVSELNLIFEMLISVSRLSRVPTLKEKVKESGKERVGEVSFGLLGYPVLQAADILMVKANLVPVGRDQESHIEITREIAKSFNTAYGEVFPLPKALVSEDFLPGTDGQPKMGKSLDNAIYLSDDFVTLEKKVMSMYTDPTRLHINDPGKVEGNPVFAYHRAFNSDKSEVSDLEERYKKGKVGDVEVKQKLLKALQVFLSPIQEKRKVLDSNPEYIEQVILEGSEKTQKKAESVLKEVRESVGLLNAIH